jgi:2-oxo-4-hydroxy-4-carboxy-5-ureidoimidazoline decarboxylase
LTTVATNVSAGVSCGVTNVKESMLQNAESRLENSQEEEVEIALGEIAKIARLRLQDLVELEGGRR